MKYSAQTVAFSLALISLLSACGKTMNLSSVSRQQQQEVPQEIDQDASGEVAKKESEAKAAAETHIEQSKEALVGFSEADSAEIKNIEKYWEGAIRSKAKLTIPAQAKDLLRMELTLKQVQKPKKDAAPELCIVVKGDVTECHTIEIKDYFNKKISLDLLTILGLKGAKLDALENWFKENTNETTEENREIRFFFKDVAFFKSGEIVIESTVPDKKDDAKKTTEVKGSVTTTTQPSTETSSQTSTSSENAEEEQE